MDFLLNHGSLCSAFHQAAANAISVRILAAWATCGAGVECLRECRALHKRAIIGTTFAVTDPEALHRLIRLGFDLRVIECLPNGGTFHPKVYIFEQPDGEFIAILGSANLTDAAFARNCEVMVRVHLQAESALDLNLHFDHYWNSQFAQPVSDAWFSRYVERYRKALLNRDRDAARAERPGRHSRILPATPQTSELYEFMRSDWAGYINRLSNRKDLQEGYLDSADDSYLHTLSLVTPLLRSGLASADQKSIARILGHHECGWLGTVRLMRGRGAEISTDADLQHLVDDCLRPLWSATSELECIECAGEVFERLQAIDGFGPGFITRMLAIARPDRFYSCNVASRRGLAELLGISKSRIGDWKGYRKGLHIIYSTRWYGSPEPLRPELKKLWNARVALLDAYVYQAPNA